jgi:endonuclease III related protein
VPSPGGVYRLLLKEYGPQDWWPGDTAFEVAIGAILTQNVAWKNVEIAIRALKEAKLLSPRALHEAPGTMLAPLIRPTGYYNQKVKKIKNFLEWYRGRGYSFRNCRSAGTGVLREELLAVNGIGPETADSILLYALERKVFVVDAYTRRIFTRLGVLSGRESYHDIQRLFHARFRGDVPEYNEYHALIVNHGKNTCKKTPRCTECCLARVCARRIR